MYIACIPALFSFFSPEAKAQVAASFLAVNNNGCSPLNVQFTNTSTGATSYFWDFGDGNTSTLQNPSDIYLVAGNYTVKLVAYAANGQADSVIQNNIVSVIQQPVPSFLANVTTACENNNLIQFSNFSTFYDSCLWDFGDGGISSLPNPNHTYTTAGNFSVTLICFNSTNGCSESFTRNQYITIYAIPAATVTVNVNTSCDPAQLFSFTASANSAVSFLWNFGDNTTSSSQNPSHTYSAPGTYTVSLITSNAAGCKDTLVLNNYIDLKNNPVPVITLSDSSACAPFWFNYGVTGTFSSVLWTFGDGDSSTKTSSNHGYVSTGTYTISATVVYSNGCTNTVSYANMQALTTPVANIKLSNFQGCKPLNVQCINNSSNGSIYSWDFGDGTFSSAFSPSHVYTNNGLYDIKLTVSNLNGCSAVSVPWTANVLGPGADIYTDVTSGCPPLTVNFFGNPIGQTAYFWNFGDGTTSTSLNPQHTYNSLGSYTVKLAVTNSFGCTDTVINPVVINVANPVSNFIPPAPVFGCAPMTIHLNDNTPGATSWQWNYGDGNTGTGQSVSHTYSNPGTYVVSLITNAANGGCEQTIPDFSTFIIGGGTPRFSYIQTICPPYIGYFQDSSVNAVSWFWDFGDGNTSTLQSPTHVYDDPGVYNVSLTITTADGCTVTCVHNYALSFDPLIANASASTNDTVLPFNVFFFANSTGATNWLWNFGDGFTSTLENPTHTYTVPGPWTISLTIGNDSCSFTYTYPPTTLGVGTGPLGNPPDSIHNPVPFAGCSPLNVNFHNPFINTISWLWDFGDGTSSIQSDPVHVYTIPGTYDVTLIATHSNGINDTLVQPSSIIVTGTASAGFSIAKSNGCAGTTIQLIADSANIAGYLWNFGDSTTSVLSNPIHTYPNNGLNYIISFFATDSSGCTDFMTQSFYAAATNTLQASKLKVCSSDSVYFQSGNINFNSYVWHFGDGDSSLLQNAYHQYNDSGMFSVTLTVTDTAGCSQTLTLPGQVMVYDPEPSFTMVNDPNCVGLFVNFTNTSLNADSWHWDFGDGTASNSKNPNHLYTLPGVYTVSLTAYKNNCSKTYTLTNGVTALNTTVNFTYTQDKNCLPVTISCQDLSTDVTSWLWDFGDGSTSVLQNPQHTFYNVPPNDVELTITNVYGCHLTMSLPKIKPSIALFNLIDTSGCSPLTTSFADSSKNVASWYWNFGDGNSSVLQNPQHTYLQDGFYNIMLVVTSTDGCKDTVQADSAIQVSSLNVNFSSNISAACAPAVIDFTDLSLNATKWNWSFGDGSSSQLQNPTHIYATPGLYDVKLVTANGQGCTDSVLMAKMITVNGPVTGFMVSDTSGCAPVAVQFTDTSLNAVSWQWSFGDGSASTSTSPQHSYNDPGQYSVSLITEDSLGCKSAYSYPYTFTINLSPTALFTVSDTLGCSPLTVNFISNSTGFDSLVWYFGDGQTLTNNSSATYTYVGAGTWYPYLVAFTTEGCSDTFYLNQPVHTILTPIADFSNSTDRGCAPLLVGFNNLSSSVQNSSSFLWNFGNGDTSTLSNPSYTYPLPGIYTVTLTVTNENFCSDTRVKTALIQVYDLKPPPESPILRVTVIDDSKVEILWQNSAVPDLASYELYKLNPVNNTFELLYTDANPNNSGINLVSKYTDTLLNTLQNTYTYKLQTIDLCGNALPLDSLGAHRTINITAQTLGKGIHISWTRYSGCTIKEYDLYRSDPSTGNLFKIGTVPASDSAFTDTTLICPDLYVYRVTATDVCGNTYTSDSDTSMAKPENALENQQVEITRTTVVDDLNTLTEWKPPVLAPEEVVAYSIYRSETENGNYILIGNVGPAVTNFMDTQVEVHQNNYYYKVEVVNKCNAETLLSTIGSSILLLANPENNITRLVWTSYKAWDSGVGRYVIEKLNSNGVWETIKVVDGNTLETEDK